jgi:tetratricopeptide (TPR) repeat protein
LNALNQQVYQLIAQGKYQEAIPIAERAVELANRVYGPENLGMAQSLNNLALVYQDMGEYAKAETLYQETLRICQKLPGREHPDTATSLSSEVHALEMAC